MQYLKVIKFVKKHESFTLLPPHMRGFVTKSKLCEIAIHGASALTMDVLVY